MREFDLVQISMLLIVVSLEIIIWIYCFSSYEFKLAIYMVVWLVSLISHVFGGHCGESSHDVDLSIDK